MENYLQKEMSLNDVIAIMKAFNRAHKIFSSNADWQDGVQMIAEIVLSQNYFVGIECDIPKDKRTFYFCNYEKGLCEDDIGNSIYAELKDSWYIERIDNLKEDEIESVKIISAQW